MAENKEALELTNQAVAIALAEIRRLKQEAETLQVKNAMLRSIMLGACRCYSVDPFSKRLFDDHIGRVYGYISGLAEKHPDLGTLADDVREFMTVNDAPLRSAFEIIEGGASGRVARTAAGVDPAAR